MVRLILIRHARVLVQGLCYGRFDPETEALDVGWPELWRRLLSFDRLQHALTARRVTLHSSPARRCSELAERLGGVWGLVPSLDSHLAELSMGEWEGQTYEALAALPSFEQWMENWKEASPPGGEAVADLLARVRTWLEQCDASRLHVVATHAGVIRALRVHQGASWEQAMDGEVPHLTPIEWEARRA